jgi:6-phosphogluconolactonase
MYKGQFLMTRKLSITYSVLSDAAALADRAAQHFAELIEEAVDDHGRARIAISGGSTPRAAFQRLADPALPWRSQIAWERVELFWVDERTVPPDHAESNFRMTREALLDHVPIPAAQIHRMEGELEPEAAAARYESELRNTFRLEGAELPRFDIVSLGMGADGHTASLFPHTAAIHELGRLVVANPVPQLKTCRLTLTWPVIDRARSIFFLISGADKAEMLRDVFQGPHDPERLPCQLIWPASGILTLILDQAAAAHLPPTNGNGHGLLERER